MGVNVSKEVSEQTFTKYCQQMFFNVLCILFITHLMMHSHFQHKLYFLSYFMNVFKMIPVKPQLFYKHLVNILRRNNCIDTLCHTFLNIKKIGFKNVL